MASIINRITPRKDESKQSIRFMEPKENNLTVDDSIYNSSDDFVGEEAEISKYVEGKDILQKVRKEYFNYRKIKLDRGYGIKKSAHKVVLVIGKARSGKTQLITNLMHPGSIGGKEMTSDTAIPICNTLTVEYNDTTLTVDFIDTPGFMEARQNARTDPKIKEVIIEGLKKINSKVNMILIVTRNPHDEFDQIRYCVEMFGEAFRENLYMMMTYRDNSSKDSEQKDIQNFRDKFPDGNVIDLIGDKILFTGCIPEDFKKYPEFCREATTMQIQRNKMLFDHILKLKAIPLSEIQDDTVTIDRTLAAERKELIDLHSKNQDAINKLKAEYKLISGKFNIWIKKNKTNTVSRLTPEDEKFLDDIMRKADETEKIDFQSINVRMGSEDVTINVSHDEETEKIFEEELEKERVRLRKKAQHTHLKIMEAQLSDLRSNRSKLDGIYKKLTNTVNPRREIEGFDS